MFVWKDENKWKMRPGLAHIFFNDYENVIFEVKYFVVYKVKIRLLFIPASGHSARLVN